MEDNLIIDDLLKRVLKRISNMRAPAPPSQCWSIGETNAADHSEEAVPAPGHGAPAPAKGQQLRRSEQARKKMQKWY